MPRDNLPQTAARFTPRSMGQEKALAALLSGASVTRAARAANVDRATLTRWLSSDAGFIASYNGYRSEMVAALRDQLRFMAADAIKAIRSLITDEATPPAIRLKAAQGVLDLVLAEKPAGPTDVE